MTTSAAPSSEAEAFAIEVAGGPPAPLITGDLQGTLQRHKLLAASEAFRGRLDADQVASLAESWRLMAARRLARQAERVRIFDLLASESVPVVEIKGDALQRSLGGSARDSVDLDLWVRPLDFRRTLRELCKHGYRVHAALDPERIHGPLPNELPLVHDTLGLEVDVHQVLFAGIYALDEVDAVLRDQVEDHTMLPAAAAFHAHICGAKDLWNTLRTVADLAAIDPALDRAIDRYARLTRTGPIVAHGRRLVRALNRGDLPASARGPRQERPTWDRLQRYLSLRSPRHQLRCLRRLPFAVRYQDLLEGPVDSLLFPVRRMRRLTRTYVLR